MSEHKKRKKILVIGAGDFQLPLVQKASETCDVLLAAPVISEAFEPYIKERLLTDVRDEMAILAFAKEKKIDGVITDQTDIAVRSVAYVAEKMKLPGIGYETGVLFTDKSLMRARLAELGIHQLKNMTVSSLEEAVSFYRHLSREKLKRQASAGTAASAAEGAAVSGNAVGASAAEGAAVSGNAVGASAAEGAAVSGNAVGASAAEGAADSAPVRVIIKPLDTQGSRGVQVCASEQELQQKYNEAARWSSNHEVIVEQFATGREFIVESLVLNYEYHTLCIGDTLYFDIPDAFAAKSRIFPTTADDALRRKVLELDEKIIRGFRLRQGITHSEYIMEGDEVYLIETAARGGGVYISSDLIHLSSGLDTEQFLIDIALGNQKKMPVIHPQLQFCGYMAFYLPVGRVIRADGIEEVCSLPFVHRNQLFKLHTGLENKESVTDKTSRLAVIVSGATRDELESNMEKVRSTLKIEIQAPDGSVREPIWK